MANKSDAIDKIIEQSIKYYPLILKAISELKPLNKNNITHVARKLRLSRTTTRVITYILALLGYIELRGEGNNLFLEIPSSETRRIIALDKETAEILEQIRNILETWLLLPMSQEAVIKFILFHLVNIDKPLAKERLEFISKKLKEEYENKR